MVVCWIDGWICDLICDVSCGWNCDVSCDWICVWICDGMKHGDRVCVGVFVRVRLFVRPLFVWFGLL